jgi:hypothetical protein
MASHSGFTAIGTINLAYASTATGYLMDTTASVLMANASGASITVTLPTSEGIGGRFYTIKKVDATANAVTVSTPTTAQLIDGSTTQALIYQNTSLDIVSDGQSNWSIT